MSDTEQEKKFDLKNYLVSMALVLLLSLMVICGILNFMGPHIGNVFSRMNNCLCLYSDEAY